MEQKGRKIKNETLIKNGFRLSNMRFNRVAVKQVKEHSLVQNRAKR
jgi:hypothetical protein